MDKVELKESLELRLEDLMDRYEEVQELNIKNPVLQITNSEFYGSICSGDLSTVDIEELWDCSLIMRAIDIVKEDIYRLDKSEE